MLNMIQRVKNHRDEMVKANQIRLQNEYESEVVKLIRDKYSENDELAILRQRDSKPDEFAQYNKYCESCKATAKLKIFGE